MDLLFMRHLETELEKLLFQKLQEQQDELQLKLFNNNLIII